MRMTATSAPRLTAPLFIVGHARSGTTLLATMLGRHPHLAATPETHFFNEGRYALAPHYASGAATVARRIATTRLRHLELTGTELTAALQPALMTDRGVVTGLLSAWLARSGKARIVEKTPVHIRHIDDILTCLPDARILWIQRDARACIASLRRVDWASHDVNLLARQWVRNMAFGLNAQRRHKEHILTLRYEDLTANPLAEISRVLTWAGEPFSPLTLAPHTDVTTITPAEESWKANVRRPILTDRAGAWRQELTADQIDTANRIAGPMLRRLGYDAPGAAAGLRQWVRDAAMNSAPGVSLQKLAFNHRARRRFGPWGANRGTKP